MGEAKHSAEQLANLAKLQQMKLNTRLAALEAATKLGLNNAVDVLAAALEFENYILDNIEQETEAALAKARESINRPQIVRP